MQLGGNSGVIGIGADAQQVRGAKRAADVHHFQMRVIRRARLQPNDFHVQRGQRMVGKNRQHLPGGSIGPGFQINPDAGGIKAGSDRRKGGFLRGKFGENPGGERNCGHGCCNKAYGRFVELLRVFRTASARQMESAGAGDSRGQRMKNAMAIYMQSTLELRAMDLTDFRAAMVELVAIVTGEGWKLVAAIEQMTGRLHTAIDIWELPDLDAYPRAVAVLRAHPRFPVIGVALAAAIQQETIILGARASWAV